MIFRNPGSIPVIDHLAPRVEISGKSNWISITELPSALEVFRLQRPNKIVDLNRLGLRLNPGSFYRFETNDSFAIFQIDSDARKKEGSNLIRLPQSRSDKISSGYR